jgi:polyisoprenoid-binding protein YceI
MNFKSRQAYLPFFTAFLVVFASFANAAVETYKADPAHSSVDFSIRHFFSKVTGRFQKFNATLTVDREAMEKSEVKATIDVSSIDTNQEKRDTHLRSADFFDATKYPTMTFHSKSWKKVNENEFDVLGDLTLHGATKPVTLRVKSLGFGPGMKDTQISGWEAKTTIKRSDFGITTGAPAVGEEVEIQINVEATKQ